MGPARRFALLAFLLGATTLACAAETDGEEVSDQEGAASTAARRFEPGVEKNGEFSKVNAAWLARAADVVYESQVYQTGLKNRLATELKRLGGPALDVKAYRFFESTNDTQAVYVATDRIAILAFRGTESKADIWTDLQFRKVPLGKGDVHRGFYNVFEPLWSGKGLTGENKQGLGAYLKEQQAQRPDVPLYVTGHSLGAALSTLGVHAALMGGQKVFAHYTFGSPRVGNDAFVNELAAKAAETGTKMFRVVNYGDVVTVSPPAWLFYGHIAAPKEKEDEGNKRFIFLGKNSGEMFQGTHKGQHDFSERVSAYWATYQAKSPQYHPSRYYVCKLDKLIDPNAKCIEVASAKAHPGCLDLANAVATAVSRPTSEGGCGESYDESVKGYLEAAACSRVKGLRDERQFRTSCLPAVDKLTCAKIKSGDLGNPACQNPFVYEAEPETEPFGLGLAL